MDIVKECRKQYKNQIRKENCCHHYVFDGVFENPKGKICEIYICEKCKDVKIDVVCDSGGVLEK